MQVFSVALPLAALVSGIYAAPSWDQPADDACLAAVTGKAALGDSGLRAFHCKSFLATTVTPVPITETVTITGEGSDKNGWKRATVAVCPNEVPNYASACDEAHYTSACSVFGFTDVITTTVDPTTTTKTVFVRPTGGVVVSGTTCPGASTVTKTVSGSAWGGKETVTVTVGSGTTWGGKETVTVTVGSGTSWGGKETVTVTAGTGSATVVTKTVTVSGSGYGVTGTTVTRTVSGTCSSHPAASSTTSPEPSKCVLTDAKASDLVDGFITLLEYTNYVNPTNGSFPPNGRGYKQDVSDAILDENFVDISDSINFMAGIPLGSTTFPSKRAFDGGQGSQPEVSVQTLNLWHDCDTITWRWAIVSTTFPVIGINRFSVNEKGLFIRNYAEFDSGAWLQSFGQSCAINPPSKKGSFDTKRSLPVGHHHF